MKPTFTVLLANYPKSELRESLYKQIGWEDVVDHPGYQDTCAIRMSLALLKSGVIIGGASARVNAGPLRGHTIEIGQARLSKALWRIWGQPEK